MTHPDDPPQIEHPAAVFQGADDLDLDDLKSRINPAYANTKGTESYERRLCVERIEQQAKRIEELTAEKRSAIAHWCDEQRKREELEAELASIKNVGMEPVAFLQTLHMEGGQTQTRLSSDDISLWGVAGRDYDASYAVTVEPIYTAAQLAKARMEGPK